MIYVKVIVMNKYNITPSLDEKQVNGFITRLTHCLTNVAG